jgi:hypothetical protein
MDGDSRIVAGHRRALCWLRDRRLGRPMTPWIWKPITGECGRQSGAGSAGVMTEPSKYCHPNYNRVLPQPGASRVWNSPGPAATLAHVCASQPGHHTQGSDSAGGYLTTVACRAGPGRSPICMSCTTGRLALPGRQPAAVRTVGSSAPPVSHSACSGTGP